MKTLRTTAATLLAIPLLVFGANYFLNLFPLPEGDGSAGDLLLQSMRTGGLMSAIALSHVVIGVGLLIPRTRFLAALLQLPLSIGILAFHVTMLPAGTIVACILLAVNLAVLADPLQCLLLLRKPA